MTNPNSIVPKEAAIKPSSPLDSPPNSPARPVNVRGQWTHNPIVLAAMACSNMHSCEEVKAMYNEW